MSDVLLVTRLKVADPTAMTALNTLRDRLGLSLVAGLSREEVFLMQVDAEPSASRDLVERLVRQTNLFLNPNKHTWRIEAPEAAEASADRHDGRDSRVWLLVRGSFEDQDFRESLWRRAGAREIVDLRRAWLWRFDGEAAVPRDQLMAAAERASLVTSRNAGFLVHPSFQDCRLYDERPNLYDIKSMLDAAQPEGLPAE